MDVKSAGLAAQEQELYMGRYKRLPDDYNGRPAYIKNTTEPLFIYYYSNEKKNLNLWEIGPIIIAGIRNSLPGPCVDSLGDGWIYNIHCP